MDKKLKKLNELRNLLELQPLFIESAKGSLIVHRMRLFYDEPIISFSNKKALKSWLNNMIKSHKVINFK